MSTGLNLTGEILRTGLPLARTALEQAPAIINSTRSVLRAVNSDENRERVSQVSFVNLVQSVKTTSIAKVILSETC